VYAPAPSWRIIPARIKSTWLGATASAGVSLSVGIRAFDHRTGPILLDNRNRICPNPGLYLEKAGKVLRTRNHFGGRLLVGASDAVYQIDPPGRRSVRTDQQTENPARVKRLPDLTDCHGFFL